MTRWLATLTPDELDLLSEISPNCSFADITPHGFDGVEVFDAECGTLCYVPKEYKFGHTDLIEGKPERMGNLIAKIMSLAAAESSRERFAREPDE